MKKTRLNIFNTQTQGLIFRLYLLEELCESREASRLLFCLYYF